ncbi:hypothetical protein K9L67_01975 [Candidatus Woesearchaeota archaeon]|nr:hypothetical protein [Candidatus Woesearchaeota archaeon]MCF7900971.1 hypothetical protein [Candidatus Woesearchaeota archaeon]MCF8013313.1 hypothetical protein [Candidatus Woesearchaeota archaeon]
MKQIKKRGASFFTIDAMIAGLIIVAAVTALFSSYISKPEIEDVQTVLNNYVDYISTTKMKFFTQKNTMIYYDENEPHPDYSVHQKIAYLWDTGTEENRNKSRNFLKNFTDVMIPKQFGFRYKYKNEIIYNYSTNIQNPIINISMNLATFYIDDSENFIGPETTRIEIWSK